MRDNTKALLIFGALSFVAYALYKEGCNGEANYKQDSSGLSIEQLQKELDIAVEKEDYEKAAILRDKILSVK